MISGGRPGRHLRLGTVDRQVRHLLSRLYISSQCAKLERQHDCDSCYMGSIPIWLTTRCGQDGLSRYTFNVEIAGSNPVSVTILLARSLV